MIRRGLLIAAAILACCPLSCGKDEEQPEKIVLRVANWGSPMVENDFMRIEREITAEFERRHPGVRVQIEQIPGLGQYAPKLTMMHIAGCMPDVVHLDASSAAVFVDNGVLRDLTPIIKADPSFDLSMYFERAADIARRGDKLYAIPLDLTPMMVYYNKKLLDAAGVAYPTDGWTWDEFLQTAKALTVPSSDPKSQTPAQFGFNFENHMPFWFFWTWTAGGDVLSPDGKRASGYFDGPESTAGIQFLTDLVLKHHVAPTLAEKKASGADLFLTGKAAMDVKGHWMLIDYGARQMDVGVVGLPSRDGKPITVMYEAGQSISASTKHPELAWEYIKYMTSTEVQTKRVATGLAISGNRVVADYYNKTPVEAAFLQAVEYARPPWGSKVEPYPIVEGLGEEAMEDIVYGGEPVPQTLSRAARLMDAALGH